MLCINQIKFNYDLKNHGRSKLKKIKMKKIQKIGIVKKITISWPPFVNYYDPENLNLFKYPNNFRNFEILHSDVCIKNMFLVTAASYEI